MKKKKHSEAEILKILKEGESGLKADDLCRSYNISMGTYYRWKSKYGGMDLNEMKRLKELEHENTQLKSKLGKTK